MPKTEFLYLSEPDMIAAGVLDAARCVDICEETFKLLGEGDYLMGGSNHNNHGMYISFPKKSKFPNMPVAGPDRRFGTMPGYLGGRYDICGNKWYGSNAENAKKDLPRSVLTLMLNNKDSGEPISLMSANLLSSARTGAVPGVGARHLANKDAEVVSVVGCGPINKASFTAVMTQMTKVKKVVCFDLFLEKARELAKWAADQYDVEAMAVDSAEEGFVGADVITVAASRLKPLKFEDSWIKEGATILVSGPVNTNESFWLNSTIVYDHTQLHEAYVGDAISSGDKIGYYNGVIGGPLYKLIDAEKLPPLNKSTGLGDVVLGNKVGRKSAKDRVVFIACGMSVFDISWGYEMYQSAQEKGLGQRLTLWEKPYIS
jgi:ornithine cyclodeaminase/alanine dehydrogenase-like protein (mu-crystallin family)